MATVYPWIIRKKRKNVDQRPCLYIDPPSSYEKEQEEKEESERGVLIIYEGEEETDNY